MHWKKLDTTTLLSHPRVTVVEDDVELPDGEQIKYLRFENTSDTAMVICIRDDKLLLQSNYSYGCDQTMYELPGGGIDKDESPVDAALRELIEETGNKGDSGIYLGFFYTDNRRSNRKIHAILVTNPTEVERSGGDNTEFITPEWIALDEVRNMIARGEVMNVSILTGLAFYDSYVQKAFITT